MEIVADTVTLVNLADKGVFHEIFEEHYASLCLFADRYVNDCENAADIVQDAFVALWAKRENFSNKAQVKSFLYTCVRNSALNELKHADVVRQNAEFMKVLEDETNFHGEIVRSEVFRIMKTEISHLPKQMASIMELSLEGMKNKEIATELNISINTVRTLKRLAYKKLRKSLGHRLFIVLLFIVKFFA